MKDGFSIENNTMNSNLIAGETLIRIPANVLRMDVSDGRYLEPLM